MHLAGGGQEFEDSFMKKKDFTSDELSPVNYSYSSAVAHLVLGLLLFLLSYFALLVSRGQGNSKITKIKL